MIARICRMFSVNANTIGESRILRFVDKCLTTPLHSPLIDWRQSRKVNEMCLAAGTLCCLPMPREAKRSIRAADPLSGYFSFRKLNYLDKFLG